MPASDLPTKPDSNACIEPPSKIEGTLDNSFAEIDWQAPWLLHITQRHYLSTTIEHLSRPSQQMNNLSESSSLDNAESLDTHGINACNISTPDTIANVLKTAMQQQANHLEQPLPQTKPTHNQTPQTLQFVSQNALPDGEAYESFIGSTGNIPTRDNLHDLFNGSIWLTFPKTKALLNHYHMLEIEQQGVGASRGRVRDTITVFDENGAVLVTANPSIGEALIGFDWQGSLVQPRTQWDDPTSPSPNAQAVVYIFGHALLEQLITPRKPLCAHSVVISVGQDFFALSTQQRIAFWIINWLII
ncbi:hypothetical protein PKHYL_39410 [Psychrobacter sp. KH172YL61]|nr:DUF3025 domain-containing protein [Psychrobacter sp. KH172YL61]BBI69750.1 hypothetical protein PKHYL_39410 [Psychrobacter sp. KH172YL61]